MKKIIILLFSGLIIYAATGCKSTPSCLTVVPPDINLTGEKTVIERQIVGDYREIEKDAWIVSSVKTTTGRQTSDITVTGSPELQKALKIRDYHTDKIAAYKKEGAIGEMNSGFVSYRETGKYKSNNDLKKILLTVIAEENKARKAIFSGAAAAEGGTADKDRESFGRAFADEQRGLALKGEWIQENSGRWVRKK